MDIHLVLENYTTHKAPMIQRWLLIHPRFKLHFAPTNSSWINRVERWFDHFKEKRIRRGTLSRLKLWKRRFTITAKTTTRTVNPLSGLIQSAKFWLKRNVFVAIFRGHYTNGAKKYVRAGTQLGNCNQLAFMEWFTNLDHRSVQIMVNHSDAIGLTRTVSKIRLMAEHING